MTWYEVLRGKDQIMNMSWIRFFVGVLLVPGSPAVLAWARATFWAPSGLTPATNSNIELNKHFLYEHPFPIDLFGTVV